MAPQRAKRTQDEDYEPLLKDAPKSKSSLLNKAFKAEAHAIVAQLQCDLHAAIDAHSAEMDTHAAQFNLAKQELEAQPLWDVQIRHLMLTAQDSIHEWQTLLKTHRDQYNPLLDSFDADCVAMAEGHKLELARQARKIKKLTKASIQEQAQVEQHTERAALQIARSLKRTVRF